MGDDQNLILENHVDHVEREPSDAARIDLRCPVPIAREVSRVRPVEDALDRSIDGIPEHLTQALDASPGDNTRAGCNTLQGWGHSGGHLSSTACETADSIIRMLREKQGLTGDFLAETEGFEPSVPVRGLHLSRVVH